MTAIGTLLPVTEVISTQSVYIKRTFNVQGLMGCNIMVGPLVFQMSPKKVHG
jgi:hypothetical protein